VTDRPGFFIPCRYAHDVVAPPDYPALTPFFARAEPAFRHWLGVASSYLPRLLEFTQDRPPAPRFDQDWFPRLDAALAYTLVRHHRPRRIVEIGSGHSTRFLAQAIADGGLETRFTSIDPAPRATIASLSIEHVRARLQEAGSAPFVDLGAGDILFVDSSHILMPGTDVDIVLNAILAALPSGALVHFHDIFLPDAYPSSWAWRGYNEQNAVASVIAAGGWRVVWASHYVATRLSGDVNALGLGRLALVNGAHESSLWLIRA
jgi:predicted O-methyltransferase YrrM